MWVVGFIVGLVSFCFNVRLNVKLSLSNCNIDQA